MYRATEDTCRGQRKYFNVKEREEERMRELMMSRTNKRDGKAIREKERKKTKMRRG
jgi:hypothetical protein